MPALTVTNLGTIPKTVDNQHFAPGVSVDVPLSLGMKMAGRDTFDVRPADGVDTLSFETTLPHRYQLLWMGAFGASDGYTVVSEATLHALLTAGNVDATVHPCWFVERSELLPETHQLIDAPVHDIYQMGVCLAPPRFFAGLPTQTRVGWTMWETTDFRSKRPEWQEEFARANLDLLLVPTPWQVKVYRESGWVSCPVQSVPLAIPRVYQPMERLERDTFTVATWGVLVKRKGVADAIEVFRRAFPLGQYPDCRLRLKTKVGVLGHDSSGHPIPPDLSDPRIEVYDEIWPPQHMLGFLYEADCALFMSYAEGFGVPARESIATGLPTILSNNSGHEPIADERYTWPVPTKAVVASEDQGGFWWQPDSDVAVDMLRDVYHNRGMAYAKAQAGTQWFHETWGPERIAEDLLSTLGEL